MVFYALGEVFEGDSCVGEHLGEEGAHLDGGGSGGYVVGFAFSVLFAGYGGGSLVEVGGIGGEDFGIADAEDFGVIFYLPFHGGVLRGEADFVAVRGV